MANVETSICEVCGDMGGASALLICDNALSGCTAGRHFYCFNPIRTSSSFNENQEWYCDFCTEEQRRLAALQQPSPVDNTSREQQLKQNGQPQRVGFAGNKRPRNTTTNDTAAATPASSPFDISKELRRMEEDGLEDQRRKEEQEQGWLEMINVIERNSYAPGKALKDRNDSHHYSLGACTKTPELWRGALTVLNEGVPVTVPAAAYAAPDYNQHAKLAAEKLPAELFAGSFITEADLAGHDHSSDDEQGGTMDLFGVPGAFYNNKVPPRALTYRYACLMFTCPGNAKTTERDAWRKLWNSLKWGEHHDRALEVNLGAQDEAKLLLIPNTSSIVSPTAPVSFLGILSEPLKKMEPVAAKKNSKPKKRTETQPLAGGAEGKRRVGWCDKAAAEARSLLYFPPGPQYNVFGAPDSNGNGSEPMDIEEDEDGEIHHQGSDEETPSVPSTVDLEGNGDIELAEESSHHVVRTDLKGYRIAWIPGLSRVGEFAHHRKLHDRLVNDLGVQLTKKLPISPGCYDLLIINHAMVDGRLERTVRHGENLADCLATPVYSSGLYMPVFNSVDVLQKLAQVKRPLTEEEYKELEKSRLFPNGLIIVSDLQTVRTMSKNDLKQIFATLSAKRASNPGVMWKLALTNSDHAAWEAEAAAVEEHELQPNNIDEISAESKIAAENFQIWQKGALVKVAKILQGGELAVTPSPQEQHTSARDLVKHAVQTAHFQMKWCRLVYVMSSDEQVLKEAAEHWTILSGMPLELLEFLKSYNP